MKSFCVLVYVVVTRMQLTTTYFFSLSLIVLSFLDGEFHGNVLCSFILQL